MDVSAAGETSIWRRWVAGLGEIRFGREGTSNPVGLPDVRDVMSEEGSRVEKFGFLR